MGVYLISFVCLIIFYIIKRPRVGPNEPPLVPYKIPILGHTLSYLFDPKDFIKKCKEQYGECFSIYVFGRVTTVVSRSLINQVLVSHDDFDMTNAANEVLPLHKLLTYIGGVDREKSKFHVKTTREQVSGKLTLNVPIVQKHLLRGIDKLIGDCNEPKTFNNIWPMINDIIALPIANIFVGEEAASHDDVVKALGDLAFDLGPLLVFPPIFSFIHTKLNEFMITLPLRFGWNPVSNHRKVVMNRLKPIIEKRLKEKLNDNYEPHDDLLEYYMNQPDFDSTKPNNLPYWVDNIFVMVFAAIATTSKATTNALFDLAARPECVKELYEEALTISKECNGSPTLPDIQKMKKLDSFVKESLRHSDDIIGLPHYMISKSYTFSNGFTVPENRLMFLYMDDLLKSKETFGYDAEEFKPFQFVDANSPATKVDRSYVVFGGGKHACPGRFFAVNETKLILHNLILKYNFKTESGKIENKFFLGPIASPPRSALVFENRKEKKNE